MATSILDYIELGVSLQYLATVQRDALVSDVLARLDQIDSVLRKAPCIWIDASNIVSQVDELRKSLCSRFTDKTVRVSGDAIGELGRLAMSIRQVLDLQRNGLEFPRFHDLLSDLSARLNADVFNLFSLASDAMEYGRPEEAVCFLSQGLKRVGRLKEFKTPRQVAARKLLLTKLSTSAAVPTAAGVNDRLRIATELRSHLDTLSEALSPSAITP